jgi:hypothetical protein
MKIHTFTSDYSRIGQIVDHVDVQEGEVFTYYSYQDDVSRGCDDNTFFKRIGNQRWLKYKSESQFMLSSVIFWNQYMSKGIWHVKIIDQE